MSELKRFESRLNVLRADGLSDIKISSGDVVGATVEDIAAEMNRMLDAIESGKFRPLSFDDSQPGAEPVAYLRKDQLVHVRRMGPMLGEIADSPRVDRVPVYAAPQPDVAQLVEAASAALDEIEAIVHEAYNSAYPVCCGRAGSECCGSPDPEWDEVDQRIIGRLSPHQRALNAALAAYRKGVQPETTCPTCYGRGWDMDCQNEFRPATCPDCAGSGKAEHSITVQCRGGG